MRVQAVRLDGKRARWGCQGKCVRGGCPVLIDKPKVHSRALHNPLTKILRSCPSIEENIKGFPDSREGIGLTLTMSSVAFLIGPLAPRDAGEAFNKGTSLEHRSARMRPTGSGGEKIRNGSAGLRQVSFPVSRTFAAAIRRTIQHTRLLTSQSSNRTACQRVFRGSRGKRRLEASRMTTPDARSRNGWW